MGMMFVVLTGGYQMSLNTAWDSLAVAAGYKVAALVGHSHAVDSPRFDVHQQQALLCPWGSGKSTNLKPHCPQQSITNAALSHPQWDSKEFLELFCFNKLWSLIFSLSPGL